MAATDYTIDWNRCVHVVGRISDELVKALSPSILQLRQQSKLPITVAINSHGGTVSVIDTLSGLLSGPDQDGEDVSTIMVVTDKAYSAAASLLTLGDYSVALPHSSILFHDVRYGEMEDVTPERARNAAMQLKSANEKLALRLANSVFRRMTWLYIDLKARFADVKTANPTYDAYQSIVQSCGASPTESVGIDIAAFAAFIHEQLSAANRELIANAMLQLSTWATTMNAAKFVPMYAENGRTGILDGALELYQVMDSDHAVKPKFGFDHRAEDLRLFLIILMSKLAAGRRSFGRALESSLTEFGLLDSINDPQHIRTAQRLMLRHKSVFFSPQAIRALDSDDHDAKTQVMEEARPYVRTLWHLCVLLCKELVNGEHVLSPRDALVLGIVDEVPGDDLIESKRKFRLSMDAKNARPKIAPVRRLRRRST